MFDSDRTTEALLARRALAGKATPGPWEVDKSEITSAVYVETDWGHLICEGDDEDAAHIAANSPDVVMADIDEILRLRAQVERLEKEADWLISEKIVEEWNGRFVGAFNADKGGLVVYESQAVAVASWREAARKAVEEVK